MKHVTPAPALGALAVGIALLAGDAEARSRPLQVWTPGPAAASRELDPAKRLPAAPRSPSTVATAPVATMAPAATPAVPAGDPVAATARPVPASAPVIPAAPPEPSPDTVAPAAAPAASADTATASTGAGIPAPVELAQADGTPGAETAGRGRGGFFLGAQVGRGWVYKDFDQDAHLVNAGYRWQVGPVGLVGVELARGRLAQERVYDEVEHASIGANARFNLGLDNPLYALVRAGYWRADSNSSQWTGDIDGGYLGVGLGVDFNRHFNMSLIFTSHVYFEDYYWHEGDFHYDANRADTLMLGAEARF